MKKRKENPRRHTQLSNRWSHYEKEADAIANVVSHAAPREPQMSTNDSENQDIVGTRGREICLMDSTHGSSLPSQVKRRMEAGFGVKFSNVRIHDSKEAHQFCESHDARALNIANHIYFNTGEYQPNSQSGQWLLAHELAHTLQPASSTPVALRSEKKPAEDSNNTNDPNIQSRNTFAEYQFAKVSDAHHELIRVFCDKAIHTLSQWQGIRPTKERIEGQAHANNRYMTTVKSIANKLNALFVEFERDFILTPVVTTKPVTYKPDGGQHVAIVAFSQFPNAQREVFRCLNAGYFPQFLQEMLALHGHEVPIGKYRDLFMKYNVDLHKYSLHTYTLVHGGSIEASAVAAAQHGTYTLSYSGPFGLSWSKDLHIITAGVNAGSSSLGASLSLGSASVEVQKYYPPNYFDANFVALTDVSISAGKSMGGSMALTFIRIGDLTFDTSGPNAKAARGKITGAGATEQYGYSHGRPGVGAVRGLSEDVHATEYTAKMNSSITVIDAALFFRSGDDQLDQWDIRTIGQVVEAITRHNYYYPGDRFKITFVGYATKKWDYPKSSARKEGLPSTGSETVVSERMNTELAWKRAESAHIEFIVQLTKYLKAFSSVVFPDYDVSIRPGPIMGEKKTDNHPEGRKVSIRVEYYQ